MIVTDLKLLSQKCAPVAEGEDISALVTQMLDILKMDGIVGVAANQLGVQKRVFAARLPMNDGVTPGPYVAVCINPEILVRSMNIVKPIEGCLSFPGKKVITKRAESIIVRYQDTKRRVIEKELSGLGSIVFQHELDHLNGKTMYDRQTGIRA
jgi:peptide deformylase